MAVVLLLPWLAWLATRETAAASEKAVDDVRGVGLELSTASSRENRG